jgi:hypothetical protein
LPSGRPNYQFHLQYPDFHLFVAKKSQPNGQTPNVLVSLSSKLLWTQGEQAAVDLVLKELAELADGTVRECRMSRCDLAADILVPNGLSDVMIRDHFVSHAQEIRPIIKKGKLETMYVGAKGADIQLRIYNKSLEILHSEKPWFNALWAFDRSVSNVWRFEYQIRRPFLRAFKINSLDDLLSRRTDLWIYLTHEWFSLRLCDNENVTRRSIHPLWKIVQASFQKWGPSREGLQRVRQVPSLDSDRVVKQLASRLVGFAARESITDFDEALAKAIDVLRTEFRDRDFTEELLRKRIQLGISQEGKEKHELSAA